MQSYVESKPQGRPKKQDLIDRKVHIRMQRYSLVLRIPHYFVTKLRLKPRSSPTGGTCFTWGHRGKTLQLKLGQGKYTPCMNGSTMYVVIPKNYAKDAGIWTMWVLLELDESPKDPRFTSIISISKTNPLPAPKSVRESCKKVYDNRRLDMEARLEAADKYNTLGGKLNDALREDDYQTKQAKQLEMRLKINGVEPPHPPEWWLQKLKTPSSNTTYTQEHLSEMFGTWSDSPYFVVWVADRVAQLKYSELENLLKELLIDYDLDTWLVKQEIRDTYRPVLENFKHGMPLKDALRKPQPYTPFQGSEDLHPLDIAISKVKAARKEGTRPQHSNNPPVYPPEWWLKKIDYRWPKSQFSSDEYITRRFGKNWEFNPYFIAWGVQVAIICDDPKVTSHLAKLLYDYKSYERYVDDDIRIIYGPILEKVKNGTSLEKAILAAPPFGVKPEWWQAG